jgi:hypothetical protein
MLLLGLTFPLLIILPLRDKQIIRNHVAHK